MERPEITPRRVAVTAGYLLLGVVGTAVAAMALLRLLQPVQAPIYDAVYLDLGPGEATKVAILSHFVLSGAVAIAVPTVVGEYVSDRGANWRAVLLGLGAVAGLLVVFFAVSFAGLVGLPTALLWVLAVGVGVPLLLRFRYGVRSGGVPAFVGGVPVLVLLLFLAGFGLGWGWGYVVIAEEVPASSVEGADVVEFDGVPEVRDDLFTGDCSEAGDGARTCHLQLRGYEHELEATRFLADHGVRCQYRGTGRDPGSFVARHDGVFYRVTCSPHGD